MSTENLLIVVGGMLAVVGLMLIGIIVALRGRKSEFVTYAEQVLAGLVKQADVRLAPYGAALAPVHETLQAGQTLADDPGDWLVRVLANTFKTSPEVVIASLKPLFTEGLALTDGVPEPIQETAPEQGCGTAK